ncbi:unnamed protein product [Paramecium pentaurelia]|uniref:Uncharacterized protein n=1 Tax=Paramecium pentaurelia TaxID=43138 RepID=A0A8S1TK13_9CILI|nr:unnamed protein product [Paramecium pentaurelia]CAD8151522.1 unnamed protein product [Paramecium pentaurelia]
MMNQLRLLKLGNGLTWRIEMIHQHQQYFFGEYKHHEMLGRWDYMMRKNDQSFKQTQIIQQYDQQNFQWWGIR